MVEKKLLGDKTKGGFYKQDGKDRARHLDSKTLEYRAQGRRRDDQEGHQGARARSRTRASA